MADLNHLFHLHQPVRCRLDERFYKGTVAEIYPNHIIVDIPGVSDHCWFENGLNIGDVYPEYNFTEQERVTMRKMRVMVTKYGYAVVEAETEETALQKVSTMDDSEFDWSDPDDGQVVDDDVDFEQEENYGNQKNK